VTGRTCSREATKTETRPIAGFAHPRGASLVTETGLAFAFPRTGRWNPTFEHQPGRWNINEDVVLRGLKITAAEQDLHGSSSETLAYTLPPRTIAPASVVSDGRPGSSPRRGSRIRHDVKPVPGPGAAHHISLHETLGLGHNLTLSRNGRYAKSGVRRLPPPSICRRRSAR
jgi:hypothetical protein